MGYSPRVAKSRTQLSDFIFTFTVLTEEGMAVHSVFLPGESPWTEELDGLQSMEAQRVGHNLATKHSTAHGTDRILGNMRENDPLVSY